MEDLIEVKEVKPEYETFSLVKTVDGHILEKLKVRVENKQLEEITIAYYNQSDQSRYQDIFNKLDISIPINFIPSSKILD